MFGRLKWVIQMRERIENSKMDKTEPQLPLECLQTFPKEGGVTLSTSLTH